MSRGSGFPGIMGKVYKATAVTKSDATVVNFDAIFVGGQGNIAVIPYGQATAVTFLNIGDGEFIPLHVKRVMSTNTTATSIVGLNVK